MFRTFLVEWVSFWVFNGEVYVMGSVKITLNNNKFIEICRECHNSMHGRNYYGR